MDESRKGICILSGNVLKIIAAISMLIDHAGLLFFPKIIAFRMVGRLAFPIFAFMIAEGCRHTHNKARRLLILAGFSAVFQIVYYLALGKTEMCIFVTFTVSVVLIYILDAVKKVLFSDTSMWYQKLLCAAAFLLSVLAAYALTRVVHIEYGIFGCLMPVAASILNSEENYPELMKKADRPQFHVLTMGICLLAQCIYSGRYWQYPALLSLPLLLLYSGKRGKHKIKYFFYIFYPLHLVILYGISLLLHR